MKRLLFSLLRNRNVHVALWITLGVMVGQHLVNEHVLTTRHLGTWDHLVIFTLTATWLLPAAFVSSLLGLRLARLVGSDGSGWRPRVEQAALISLVMLDLLILGLGLQPLTHQLYDAVAPAHHAHGGDWLADLLLGQMLTLVSAWVGLAAVTVLDRRLRLPRLAAPSLALRMRFVSTAVIAGLLLSLLPIQTQHGAIIPATTQAATDTCTDPNAPQSAFNVTAINVRITLNRFRDNDPAGVMYVLSENVDEVRAEEATRAVSAGLRSDWIQPLVIRANLGDCVTINFTNQLNRPASFHTQGLAYTVDNAGGMVGNNPNTFANANGGTRTYKISMPPANEERGEGAYHFYSHGASRDLTSHGLFGALVAEPFGSSYLHAMTGAPLTSGWEAIITDDNPATHDFREFTIMFHEIGDERADVFDANNLPLPVLDKDVSGTYRPGSRAINYRSEPFRDRLLLQQQNGQQMDKALTYSSYTFGEPATPVPHSYLGEPTKTRLVHAGSEMFHVYHLHGGGTRWRRNPFTDDRREFDQQLKKTPTQDAHSIRLDSQSVGPSESMTLEHECAAGGCQQTAGDYLFHCHIGAHYAAGMWSFWRVFDTEQADLFQLPDRSVTAPVPEAVNSLGLIGTVVEGKTLLPAVNVSFPLTQTAIEDWAASLLPAQGVPNNERDAAVWDWTILYVNDDPELPLVLGEPETDRTWVNYTPQPSPWPDDRPEIMFNPGNGRYAWPVLRPHLGRRPPFSSNQHGGAPWAGETATATRPDGMCPDTAPNHRYYPVTGIQKPLQVTPQAVDQGGMLFVLNEEKEAILNGTKLAEPLVLRSNVGDCVDVVLTSSLEDARAAHEYSKLNLHIHFVQFDPQASDGVISGMSFEQSVRPYTTELSGPGDPNPLGRTLVQPSNSGATTITINDATGLHLGSAFGIGLDRANIEIRTITAINGNDITLDQPLAQDHVVGEPVGVEFVRYRWYSDVDDGTVFYHSHVAVTDWYHGLIGAHIIEPAGSTYHDPTTGQVVKSGAMVDIHTPSSAGNTKAGWWPGPGSGGFREFVVFFTADSPVNGASGGTINLRASPFATRGLDPGRIFSSVTNNDPWTPLFRTYLGDPVMIRGMSVVEKEGALRFAGHRFRPERFAPEGVEMDTAGLDISERYDLILEGGAGGIAQKPGDYLYYTTIAELFVDGAWGLMRVFDTLQPDLQVLPGRAPLPSGPGFPQQTVTGGAPIAAVEPGNVCPADAPIRAYEAVIFNQPISYQPGGGNIDPAGIIYALAEDEAAIRAGTMPVRPLVLRTNVGDCLEIGLTNKLAQTAGLSAGELTFDPQGSYGAAIGFNPDSTVAPATRRVYRYWADQDVGLTLFFNLANPTSAARGAFGAIVVEPAGAIYRNPLDGTPAGAGVMADIITSEGSFREYVGLLQDEDDIIGQNQMPYPVGVQGFTGLNYVAEALDVRLGGNTNGTQAQVFSSAIHGDPQNLFQTYLGDAVTLRVGKPWGTQGQVIGVEGHRWPLEPNMPQSNLISSKSFRAGEAFDMHLYGGAGGQIGAVGDYFFGDYRAPFQEAGVWGLMRVHDTNDNGPLPLPNLGVMLTVDNTPDAAQVYLNSLVTFTYTLHNPGTVALSNVNVSDDGCDDNGGTLTQTANGNGDGFLDPNESWSYSCAITLAASLTNLVTVTADDGQGGTITAADAAAVVVINPFISLTRPAPVSGAQVPVGLPTEFAYQVTLGPGSVDPLTSVVLTDDACPAITRTGGDANNNNILEAGETWVYACSTTLNPGLTTSTATVTALDSLGGPVSMAVALNVQAVTAGIQLAVEADTTGLVGSVIYNYTITNIGEATLNDVTLTDTLMGAITLGTTTLGSGATAFGGATLAIQEGHLPGPLVGQATVTAMPATTPSQEVSASASTSVPLSFEPSVDVTREAGPSPAGIGQTIFYTFTVTNNGNVALSNVVAQDSYWGNVLPPATKLAPGHSMVQTRSLPVVENLLPGPIADTVTVTAQPGSSAPIGGPVTDSDSGEVTLQSATAIHLSVSADHTTAQAGDTILYTYEVKNEGNLTLQAMTLNDSRFGGIDLAHSALVPGAKTTGQFHYVVLETDLPGPIVNQATVTAAPAVGGGQVSDADDLTITLTGDPALAVTRQASRNVATINDTIVYTFTIVNMGDVTLTDLTAVDTRLGALALGQSELAPGQSLSVGGTTVIAESDLPGPLVNQVTAQGKPKFGGGAALSASAGGSVTLFALPGLSLTQEVNTTIANVGETVFYTFTVQNIGNVTLVNVRIEDSRLGVIDIAGQESLAPGAVVTKLVSYIVTAADMPGPLNNQATVTGVPIYEAGNPDGNNHVIRATGGSVTVSASSLTLRHVVAQGFTQPAMVFDVDGAPVTLGNGEAQRFDFLTPGAHTVGIALPARWGLEDVVCSNGVTATGIGAAGATDAKVTATLAIGRGVHATCAFVTTQTPYSVFLSTLSR